MRFQGALIHVYGENVLIKHTAANWFHRFQDGNVDALHSNIIGLLWKMSIKSTKKLKKIV